MFQIDAAKLRVHRDAMVPNPNRFDHFFLPNDLNADEVRVRGQGLGGA